MLCAAGFSFVLSRLLTQYLAVVPDSVNIAHVMAHCWSLMTQAGIKAGYKFIKEIPAEQGREGKGSAGLLHS